MKPTDSAVWWRGVSFGVGLVMALLALYLGIAYQKGNVDAYPVVQVVVLVIGLQAIVSGFEYRALERALLSKLSFLLGIILLSQGLYLIVL